MDLDRFALLGISQGAAIAIAYAVKHPEKVSHLVLYGGYARGWAKRGSQEEIERKHALNTLIRLGWGRDHPVFRQMWTIVLKKDLMSTVWPETAVEENNLDRAISAVRKALGETSTSRQYIETVPRKGVFASTQVQPYLAQSEEIEMVDEKRRYLARSASQTHTDLSALVVHRHSPHSR